MAISKKDLEYKIAVDTTAAKKDVDGLTHSTEQLRDATGKFATEEQVALYNSLHKTRRELEAQAEAGKDVSEEYEKIGNQIESMGLQVQGAESGVAELGGSFGALSKAVNSMQSVLATLSELATTLDSISDPEKLKRYSNLLLVFSKFAQFKGFDGVSKGARTASDQLKLFSEVLQDSSGAIDSLFQKIDSWAGIINKIEEITSAAVTATAATGALVVGVATMRSGEIPKIAQNVKDLGKAFADTKNVASSAFSSMGSAKNVSSGVSDIGKAAAQASTPIKAFGSSLLNIGKEVPKSFSMLRDTLVNTSKTLGTFVKPTAAVGLLHLAEGAALVNIAVASLGATLLTSESTLLKVTGAFTLLAGVLLGGFSYAIKVTLGLLGSFFTFVGDKIVVLMEDFESKFQKAEVATTNFKFTIAGLSREFGTASGTLETWSALVDELSKNTLLSRSDAEKMAAEIMSVGKGLGLTQTQMEDFLRVMPDFIKAGDDAFDVTVSFLQALGGAPQGVLKYAVHLSEASVEHSKFVHTLGLSMGAMTESQKVQARFNALMEQASPIMGRGAEQLNTVAGSQQFLNKTLDEAKQRIGEQSILISTMNMAAAKLTTTLLKLPQPLYDIVGIGLDFFGVFSKLLGLFLSFAMPIAALTTLWAVFSTVIASNATAQYVLSTAMTYLNVAMGGQAIAVTSLTGLFKAFGTLLLGIVSTATATLATVIKGLALSVVTLTKALLANPLFWKAAAIAGLIYLVWKALEKIEEQTHIFRDALNGLATPFEKIVSLFKGTGGAASNLSKIFSTVLNKAIDIVVIAVSALVSGVLTLSGVLLKLLDIATFGIFDIFAEGADTAAMAISKLSNSMGESLANLTDFSEKAYAQEFKGIGEGAKEAQEALKGLSGELISLTEQRLIAAQASGKDIEAMLISKQLTEEKLKIAKEIEERKNLTRELLRINSEMAQIPKDVIEEAKKSRTQLLIASKEAMDSVAAIREAGVLKAQEALKPLQDKLSDISLLPSTEDTLKASEELKALIVDTQASISRETLKQIDDLNKSRLEKELDLKLELAKLREDELAQININADKQIAAISKTLSPERVKEMTTLILAAKDKQIAELSAKEKKAQQDANLAYATALQDQAAINSIELSRQIAEYEEFLNKKLISEAQYNSAVAALQQAASEKREDELRNASLTYANIIKNETMIAKLEYRKQMQDFKKLVDKKLITEKQYNTAIAAIEKQALDKRNTAADEAFLTYANAVKDESLIAELEYSKQLKSYKELLDKRLISFQQFRKMQIQAEKDMETRKTEDELKVANKAVSAVSGGISGVVSAIGSAFGPWGTLISGIVNLLNRSPEEMKAFVEGLIQAANNLPSIIIRNIPVIIRAIVKELPNSLRSVLGAISTLFKEVLFNGAFWRDVVNGLIDVLASTLKDLWSWVFDGVDFSGLTDGIADAVGSGLKSITGSSTNLFSVDSMGGAFKQRADQLGDSIRKAGETVKNWLGQAWEGMKQAGRWLDANVWQPAWEGLKGVGRWLDDEIFSPFYEKTKGAWLWIDENVIQPMWSLWKNMFIEWPIMFLDGLRNGLSWVVEKLVDGILEPLGKGLTTILNGIFSGDYFAKIWDGVKKAGAGAFDFFKNIGGWIVDGFKSAIGKINNVLDGLFKFPKMDRSDGVVEKFIGLEFPFLEFAGGGKVPGVAKVGGDSPRNDIIPAMLSPDEIVIPRSATLRGANGIIDFLEKMGEIKPDKRGIGGLNLYSMSDFKKDLGNVGTAIVGGASSAWDGIKSGAGAVWEGAKGAADWVKDAIVKLPADVLAAANAVIKLGGNIDWVKLIKNPLSHLKDIVQVISKGLIEAPAKAIFNKNRFSEGGLVGGYGTQDTVPAMLTPGEFVLNRQAVSNLGTNNLATLNSGKLINGSGDVTQNIDINLTINSNQQIDANLIKNKIMPVIFEQLKRASLDGRRVLAPSGVR